MNTIKPASIENFGRLLAAILCLVFASSLTANARDRHHAQQAWQAPGTIEEKSYSRRPLRELANLSHDCGYLIGLWHAYTNAWSAFSSYDLTKFDKQELIGLYYGARSALSPMRWTKNWRTENIYTYTQVVSASQIADYLMELKYQTGQNAAWWRDNLEHWSDQIRRARNIIEAAAMHICQPINDDKIYDVFSIDE